MTWTKPTLTVEVQEPGTGNAYTLPSAASWVDVSDRVISFAMDRGRQDRTTEYEPGTCTIVLDNTDRQSDPTYSGSDLYGALPLSLVRVTATYSGTDYPVFSGYVAPDAFTCDPFGNGKVSTCTITAYDRLGLFQHVPLPSSPYACMLKGTEPDWWARLDSYQSVLADGDGGPSVIPRATSWTIKDNGGGEKGYIVDGLVPADSDPAVLTKAGARVRVSSAVLFPSGAVSDMTASVIFQASTNAVDQSLLRLNAASDGSGNHRWRAVLTTAGDVVLTVYNNSGSALSFVASPANTQSGSSGRWDNDSPHLLTVRARGAADEVKMWVDGQIATISGAGIPNPYSTGYLFAGSTVADQTFDELAFWRSAITTTDAANLYRAFLSIGMPYSGDSFITRCERLFTLADWTTEAQDLDQLMADAADPDLWGLGSVESMSTSLADELARTARSYLGAVYCTREGRVRCRTQAALTSATYAADFATVTANLTDETSPAGSPTPIRRSPITFTGQRLDRVLTDAAVTCGYDAGGNNPDRIVRFAATTGWGFRDAFGRRETTLTTCIKDAAAAESMTVDYLDANTYPPNEVGDVELMPWGYDDVTTYVLGLELEQAVTLTDTLTNTTGDYRVISEAWAWQDTDWTVTLRLAEV